MSSVKLELQTLSWSSKFLGIFDFYFKPKCFERRSKLYEKLGIRHFKKFMFGGDYMNGFLRKLDPSHRMIGELGLSPTSYEGYTRLYETGHLLASFYGGSIIMENFREENNERAIAGILVNLATNIYPIMLQRYNRARIYRLLERKER